MLGLLVRRPDTIGGLAVRLEEEYPNARWPSNIVHTSLETHVRRGLARELRSGRERGVDRYEATSAGVAQFRAWLRTSAAALPAQRDALRARLNYVEDESQLAEVIGDIKEQERLCLEEADDARRRLRRVVQRERLQPSERSVRLTIEWALRVLEVEGWRDRARLLGRLRRFLEDPRGWDDTLEPEDG